MTSYVEKLRLQSDAGLLEAQKREMKERRRRLKEQRSADLAEAAQRITEAESPNGAIARSTRNGEREAVVCYLRGGIHFREKFRSKQSPKYLGLIGRTVRKHFLSKGLKVSFRYWIDPLRIMELPEDTGYELVVSW